MSSKSYILVDLTEVSALNEQRVAERDLVRTTLGLAGDVRDVNLDLALCDHDP